MPAGIGAGGAVGLAFETTLGTWVTPSIWCPIISESLEYQETKYFSPQLRQNAIVSDVKPSYYSVSGDIVIEVDTNLLPYFMYATRHTITKTGASAPFLYKFVPNASGATSTAASGAVQRTLSITVIRNGAYFGYAGCTVGQYAFTIDAGVLRCTLSIVGTSETTPGSSPVPTWVAPKLLGADAHSIFVAASGAAPTFSGISSDFNGYTFTGNHNAEAQNRIVPNRAATYVKYGETEANVNTELDFIDKTEYDLFKASATKAIKLESIGDAQPFATSTDAVKIQVNRAAYETYTLGLGGMGDLIMAGFTARALGIAGGSAYQIEIQSSAAIT